MIMATEELRTSKGALLDELQRAGARIIGNTVVCPFHEDRNPSAALYEKDGIWRYKCHAASCGFCGDIFDVRARIEGRPVEDVLKEQCGNLSKRPARTVYETIEAVAATFQNVEATYKYTNPITQRHDLVVIRYRKADGKKGFCQCRPVHGGYVMEGIPKPWPLYNRTRVAKADTVVVGEGEKVVHALHEIGIVATTSPGGAGKSDYADWSPLAGKTVYLWPDNDEGGIAHMRRVAEILTLIDPAPTVYWIDPKDVMSPEGNALPDKGDAADLVAMVRTEQPDHDIAFVWVDGVLAGAESLGWSRELRSLIEDTASGKRRAVKWPWFHMSDISRALLPATVTLLCGSPGATKSFMLLEAAAWWHEHGEKVAVYQLEEDMRYHLLRVLVQRTGRDELFDDDWMREHRAEAMALEEKHRAFLDSFGSCMTVHPDGNVTLPMLLNWIEKKANAGVRVLAIDPVTAAARSASPWIDDLNFMNAAKKIVRDAGISLFLVTHPRIGQNVKPGMDSLSGGSAFSRFSQTVMWLERHNEPEEVFLRSPVGGSTFCEINRTLHILKARNGGGHGSAIGFTFCDGSMTFHEHGVLAPKKKKGKYDDV